MRLRAHENARTCTCTAVAKSQHTRETVTAKKACIIVKEKLVIVRGERAGMQLRLGVFHK